MPHLRDYGDISHWLSEKLVKLPSHFLLAIRCDGPKQGRRLNSDASACSTEASLKSAHYLWLKLYSKSIDYRVASESEEGSVRVALRLSSAHGSLLEDQGRGTKTALARRQIRSVVISVLAQI